MNQFVEITEALRGTHAQVPALRSRVERVRASAISLENRAGSHGWAGVAASMHAAVEALERVGQELADFQQAAEAAVTQLELIDDQASVTQISTHLAAAERELDAAAPKL